MAASVGIKNGASGSGTTLAVTLAGITAGSTIVVGVICDAAGSVSGVADSQGSYTAVRAQTTDATCNLRMYYLANANSGSHTITATFTNSNSETYIRGVEVIGAHTSSPIGTSDAGTNSTGTALATAATLTGNSGDVILGFGGNESAGETFTKGSTFDSLDQQGTQMFAEYRALSGSVSSFAVDATQSASAKWVIQGVTIVQGPTVTTEQTHFRARNDDGSETTATWYAAQDTNFTAPLSTNLRLRMQVDTAGGDTPSQAYQLEYKKSTEATWIKVPTGGVGPTTDTKTTGTTWVAPTDVFAAKVECWGGGGAGARAAANSTPGGGGSGGGYSVRNAMAVTPGTTYTYNLGAGGVSATPTNGGTTTFTGDSSVVCTATGGITPAISSTTGATTQNGVAVGDTTRAGGNGANGSGTNAGGGGEAAGSSAAGANASGSTGGTGNNADGGDGGAGRTGTNGAGTAGTAPGGGGGGALRVSTTSNNGGGGALGQVKLTYTSTPRIVLATSANIAASAADATTAQLSVPNAHSFTAGAESEDTNGVTVDIGSSGYTEVEWCLQAISPAVNGDIYNFRVTVAGVALSTYTANPTWTIGTPGATTNYHLLTLMGCGG